MNGLRTCLLLGAALLTSRNAAAQQLIWRGRSGGFEITWSTGDLSARRLRDGATVFSARRMADAEWREMQSTSDEDVPVRELEYRYRLLSVVGSVISVEEASYCDCGGAHPISSTRFVSWDLARGTPQQPYPLAAGSLVAESELVAGLSRDALLRQAITATGARSFTSLAQLTERLKLHEVQPRGNDCTFEVGEQFPSEYALHHLENGRAALRFSLSHGVEVCRGMMIQLGVLATPRPGFSADLRAAAERRAGYLMKDVVAIAGDRRTVLDHQRPDKAH